MQAGNIGAKEWMNGLKFITPSAVHLFLLLLPAEERMERLFVYPAHLGSGGGATGHHHRIYGSGGGFPTARGLVAKSFHRSGCDCFYLGPRAACAFSTARRAAPRFTSSAGGQKLDHARGSWWFKNGLVVPFCFSNQDPEKYFQPNFIYLRFIRGHQAVEARETGTRMARVFESGQFSKFESFVDLYFLLPAGSRRVPVGRTNKHEVKEKETMEEKI
ncbi:unnamed protein product [Calypogeia fissa]